MMRRLAAIVICSGIAVGTAGVVDAGDPKGGPFGLERVPGGFTWDDQDGEVSYHVFGNVVYLAHPSCLAGSDSEQVDFDEVLPADSTSYQLPHEQLTWGKDVFFTIEALDQAGSVIERDGVAAQADRFCTPEEIAAAGTGPGPSSGPLPLISTALAAFGAIAIGGGLLLRRSHAR